MSFFFNEVLAGVYCCQVAEISTLYKYRKTHHVGFDEREMSICAAYTLIIKMSITSIVTPFDELIPDPIIPFSIMNPSKNSASLCDHVILAAGAVFKRSEINTIL